MNARTPTCALLEPHQSQLAEGVKDLRVKKRFTIRELIVLAANGDEKMLAIARMPNESRGFRNVKRKFRKQYPHETEVDKDTLAVAMRELLCRLGYLSPNEIQTPEQQIVQELRNLMSCCVTKTPEVASLPENDPRFIAVRQAFEKRCPANVVTDINMQLEMMRFALIECEELPPKKEPNPKQRARLRKESVRQITETWGSNRLKNRKLPREQLAVQLAEATSSIKQPWR